MSVASRRGVRPVARRSWRARLSAPALAFLGGVLAALAHPPFGVLPGVFGYALVLVALDRPTPGPRRGWPAFARGWAAGTGYLLVCTNWIVEPFLIDAAQHAWQAPFAVLWCAAGIGSLWGAAGWLYAVICPPAAATPQRPALAAGARVLAFAAAFGLWEWLRGHMLTGFPWDLAGETWRAGSPVSQAAALVGAYGLTAATLAFGAAPAVLAMPGDAGRRLLTPLAALLAFAGVGAWGARRLASAPPTAAGAPVVRVVQPDLPEVADWTPESVTHALDLYTRLTDAPHRGPRPELVVWPEGAIPESFNAYLPPGSATWAQVRDALQPGQTLLTGGYRASPTPSGEPVYYNSLAALRRTRDGLSLEGVYDKHHLVPFGEYLPAPGLFGALGMRKLISVPVDFTPGPPPRALPLTLDAGPATLQPLICYEALFPGIAEASLARETGALRPLALVNVSDDAWFGRASGPWQHLNLASYRAIEEGLPMVRSTPTGVSAVIDAFGRPASALLAPGRAGVIDAPLPPVLRSTPYARWRDRPFWAAELAAVAFALTLRRRRPRDRADVFG